VANRLRLRFPNYVKEKSLRSDCHWCLRTYAERSTRDRGVETTTLYILHIVDDATTRGWSLPVADKAQAFHTLIAWQLAVETHTGDKVKAYNIDNGELKSKKFEAFCAARCTTIRHTAPETSAQNGKVERFHLTILNKARAMMISCKALLFLSDEFVVTAAYLHALSHKEAARPLKPSSARSQTFPICAKSDVALLYLCAVIPPNSTLVPSSVF
jgi:transposase InsO family protein